LCRNFKQLLIWNVGCEKYVVEYIVVEFQLPYDRVGGPNQTSLALEGFYSLWHITLLASFVEVSPSTMTKYHLLGHQGLGIVSFQLLV
jgi:hypothetical protein